MATAAASKRKLPEDTKKRALTPAQRLFADYVIEGRQKSEAYALAYPQSSLSRPALSTEAYRTANLPHVADYIADALQERRRETLLTRDQKRQILGGIAKDPKAPRTARILAVKTDNEMTGDNAPVRVQEEITLFTIFWGMAKTTGLPGAHETKAITADALPAGVIDLTGATPEPQPVEAIEEDLIPAMERKAR